jgi:hypothetical protein
MGMLTICSCSRAGEPTDVPLRVSRLSPPDTKRLQESMQAAANIDEVNLEYKMCEQPARDDHRHDLYSSFLPYVLECGMAFKSLKRFTFQHSYLSHCSPYLPFYDRDHRYNSYWNNPLIRNCIEDANKGFGCLGKLTAVYAGTEDVMDMYMWVAEEGKFLAPKGWRNS